MENVQKEKFDITRKNMLKNTTTVQVLRNQNNSDELFIKWNIKETENIKCANSDCSNDTEDNAYIVTTLHNNKNFLLPLCYDCYKMATDYTNQSSQDSIDYGLIISIEKNLLLEYEN